MRKFLAAPALLVGLLLAAPLWAQTTAPASTLDLSGTWKFFKGDNKSWAQTTFDDALWKEIQVPGAWQEQGSPDLTGFAWYRKHVSVPSGWGNDALVRDGKVLRLDLGKIADAYEVYWNGGLIAQGGKLPPSFEPATSEVHVGVPADKTNFSGDNVLAVRVYDKAAPGGIVSGPTLLREPTYADFVAVEVQSRDDQREFTGPEGLPFDIVAMNNGPAAWQHGTVMVTVLDGTGHPLVASPVTVSVDPGKQHRTSMQLKESDLNPGIYTVVAEAQMGGKTLNAASRTFVYNPNGIRNRVFTDPEKAKAFQSRLDAFWKSTTAAAKAAPLEPAATLVPDKSTDQVKVYKVSYKSLGGQTIHGWLTVPANATKSSAVLVLPGYGNSSVDAPVGLSEAGLVALAINVHGAEVDAASYPSTADTYAKGGVDDPNTFVMRDMVVAGLRGVEFLAQRPEVDPEHIGVMGASQGGGLAVDVAALDPRVKAVVANSPAADFKRMLATAKDNPVTPLVEAMSADMKATLSTTMNYFDPVFLANRVRVPVLITIGMHDTVTPPETAYALKNAFPQGLVVSIAANEDTGHTVTPSQAATSLSWLKKFLVG